MHVPVLLQEVIKCLDPKANENFIDCTLGEAGHATAVLEKTSPRGKLLGIEQDPQIFKNTKYKILNTRYRDRLILVNDSFVNLEKIVERKKFGRVDGILLDLGISSWHLEKSGRGFSFLKDEPLDMRLAVATQEPTAEQIINRWPEAAIARILEDYSQERFARRIAEQICRARQIKAIETTLQLVEVVKKAVPRNYENGRLHPATRTFLALRMAVNHELENLKNVLPQAVVLLKPGARIGVISFNSCEDRLVKSFFREWSKEQKVRILTKKPFVASLKEKQINPRSRSAKLRAAEKI